MKEIEIVFSVVVAFAIFGAICAGYAYYLHIRYHLYYVSCPWCRRDRYRMQVLADIVTQEEPEWLYSTSTDASDTSDTTEAATPTPQFRPPASGAGPSGLDG